VVGRRSKIIKNVKLHLSQLCGSLGTYIARARARERERERERARASIISNVSNLSPFSEALVVRSNPARVWGGSKKTL
jgi:hypothetical protein